MVDHFLSLGRALDHGQAADGVEHVEKEVRIDLGLQGAQVGVSESRFRFTSPVDFHHQPFVGPLQLFLGDPGGGQLRQVIGDGEHQLRRGLDPPQRRVGHVFSQLEKFRVVGEIRQTARRAHRQLCRFFWGNADLAGENRAEVFAAHLNRHGHIDEAAVTGVDFRPLDAVGVAAAHVVGIGAVLVKFRDRADRGTEGREVAVLQHRVTVAVDEDRRDAGRVRKGVLNALEQLHIEDVLNLEGRGVRLVARQSFQPFQRLVVFYCIVCVVRHVRLQIQ